jgi:hypothetical protein
MLEYRPLSSTSAKVEVKAKFAPTSPRSGDSWARLIPQISRVGSWFSFGVIAQVPERACHFSFDPITCWNAPWASGVPTCLGWGQSARAPGRAFRTGVGARAPRGFDSRPPPRGENGESTRSRCRTLTLWFSSDRWGRPLPIGSASGSPCSSTALEPIESRLMWDVHYVTRQPEVVYPEGLFDR